MIYIELKKDKRSSQEKLFSMLSKYKRNRRNLEAIYKNDKREIQEISIETSGETI